MNALSVAKQGQKMRFCHLVMGMQLFFTFQKSFLVQKRENFMCTLLLWIYPLEGQ